MVTKKSQGERKKAKQTHTDYGLTAREFIEIWESSDTAEEVAERTKMPKAIAVARASGLRKRGVDLKMMRRGRAASEPQTVEDLNRHVVEYRKKLAQERGEAVPTAEPEAALTLTNAELQKVIAKAIAEAHGKR